MSPRFNNATAAVPVPSASMPRITKKRAIDSVMGELKTLWLDETVCHKAPREPKYAETPPLCDSMGRNHASTVAPSAAQPTSACFLGSREIESSHTGPSRSKDGGRNPAPKPKAMLAGITQRLSLE